MSSRGLSLQSRLLQSGIIVCVLVIVPGRLTGLCLCNGPKEIVLQIAGLGALSICALCCPRIKAGWVDICLLSFLALSGISGAFAAADGWEVLRPIGISAAGVAVFWSARSGANDGFGQRLLDGAAIATSLVAATVLLDTFGLGFDLSMIRPGGTLGTRNLAGHFLALGIPLIALQYLEANNATRRRLAILALASCGAALLLTRSRDAWLATLGGVLVGSALLLARRRRTATMASRGIRVVLALAAGAVVALSLPTKLRWKAAHPYAESFENLAQSENGSGQVRLLQYRNSLKLLNQHEFLGVGPGNWKIVYDADAAGTTADHSTNAGYRRDETSGRSIWFVPSRLNSDWIAFAVERGIPATLSLAAALLMIAVSSLRAWFGLDAIESGAEAISRPLILLILLTVLAIVGAFDAVLQLASPTYLVFLSLGALMVSPVPLFSVSLTRIRRSIAAAMLLVIMSLTTTYTAVQMYASYLMVQPGAGGLASAYDLALDKRWFVAQMVWSERAIARNLDYPPCD